MQERQGTVSAPGRVNLIGEHIDYHGLPVLPMALDRRIRIHYRARADREIRATSAGYGDRSFEWTDSLQPVARGDWENYLRAAARAVAGKWGIRNGLACEIESDLPPAAGLSSSSALIVAATQAILEANGMQATFAELMEILPEGEHFVGTRGGGMDHAAALSARPGHATLIEFDPLHVTPIPVPQGWRFLVANSGVTAEKSGPARDRYNARRHAGATALHHLGAKSYREVPDPHLAATLPTAEEREAFLHVTTEAHRVREAVAAMQQNDAPKFGQLLLASHASLRDRLHVSHPKLDELVTAAMDSGALGARLTGAGFGGCIVILARTEHAPHIAAALPVIAQLP
jgi:galactokinase